MDDESKELTTQPQAQVQLFGTSEPGGVIAKAREVAKQLAPIVDTCKLFNMIGGRKHVRAEGWTTMVAMLGVFPQEEYARKSADSPLTYESRILLKTIDGKVVGAGEALCSAAEKNWAGKDEYAIKSMAQTRAVGKACRLSFSWIMALAGYDPLPLEEVTDEMREKAQQQPRQAPMPTRSDAVETEAVPGNSEEGGPKTISKKQEGLIWFRLHSKFGQGKDADARCSAWLKGKLALDFGNKTLDQLSMKPDLDKLLEAIDAIKIPAHAQA